MHEVRTFAPCKAFLFDMFSFFSSLENYFGFRTTNVKGKTKLIKLIEMENLLQKFQEINDFSKKSVETIHRLMS